MLSLVLNGLIRISVFIVCICSIVPLSALPQGCPKSDEERLLASIKHLTPAKQILLYQVALGQYLGTILSHVEKGQHTTTNSPLVLKAITASVNDFFLPDIRPACFVVRLPSMENQPLSIPAVHLAPYLKTAAQTLGLHSLSLAVAGAAPAATFHNPSNS
jgi:hypothetical protein